MSTLYNSQTSTVGANEIQILNAQQAGIEFVPSSNYSLTKVALKIRKFSTGVLTLDTNITVSIRSSLSGSNLVAVSFNANLLSETSEYTDFVFSSPLNVTSGTTYYIIVRAPGIMSTRPLTNTLYLSTTTTSGNTVHTALDVGAPSWTAQSYSGNFEVYGNPPTNISNLSGISYSNISSVKGVAKASIASINGIT